MASIYLWHGLRIVRCMHRVWLFAALLLLPPAIAAAQPWADAYNVADYQKAAQLLEPIVVAQVHAFSPADMDPAPFRHLAILYAHGSGVERDPVLACALARLSDIALRGRPPRFDHDPLAAAAAYKATIEESERFARAHCDGLTQRQLHAAGEAMGCPAFGMREAKLTIGEQTIVVDRSGFRLNEVDETPASGSRCLQLVARVASRTIEPPADAAPGVLARTFVELLGWQAMSMAGDPSSRYVLSWMMFEVRGRKLETVATEHLLSVPAWPSAALPPDFDARFSVEMIRSGHVRWRFAGAPPMRGWIMRREGDSR